MGLIDKLRTELVDIIEWIDDSRHTLVWRFPRYHNQIKNGAQLIVRPGQTAIFVREGQVADVGVPERFVVLRTGPTGLQLLIAVADEALDAQPAHLAAAQHTLLADVRDVVLDRAGDDAGATAATAVEVHRKPPAVGAVVGGVVRGQTES